MMTKNKEELEKEIVNEEKNETSPKTKVETENEISEEELVEIEYKEKYEDSNDRYLRLYSDFENFRKRTAREKIDLINNASERVIKEILPVLDDLERAINSNKDTKEVATIKEGIELVFQKFKHVLTTQGLKEMDALKQEFNIDQHEAITKIPAPSKKLKGKVVDVIEKGYYLNEKVVRYAKVIIGE